MKEKQPLITLHKYFKIYIVLINKNYNINSEFQYKFFQFQYRYICICLFYLKFSKYVCFYRKLIILNA